MKVSRALLYGALAVTAVVAYAAGMGPYWLADMVVLALVAIAVAWFCFSGGAKTKRPNQAYRTLGIGGAGTSGNLIGTGGRRTDKGVPVVVDPGQRERAPRSRVAHYAIVSRARSKTLTAWLRKESDSPFERVLFDEPGWRRLSGDRLEEITRRARDAPAKGA